jgi:hypothetical protein
MEQLFSRFPHLSEAICDQLNNESFGKFKEVNRSWNLYLTDQKLYEVRIILATMAKFRNIGDGWKEVLKESSKETLVKLKHAVQEFSKNFPPWKHGGPQGGYNYGGATPLHVLALGGYVHLFETIFNKTQEKHPKDSLGRTSLHYAARFGHLEICAFIVTRIEDKSPKDNDGITPLHNAAFGGHLKVCEYLIQQVDDKNPKNPRINGFTPMHYAAMVGHLAICQLIQSNVADKNPASNDGTTPKMLAARFMNSLWNTN